MDFGGLYRFNQDTAVFVTRTEKDFKYRRLYSHQVDEST